MFAWAAIAVAVIAPGAKPAGSRVDAGAALEPLVITHVTVVDLQAGGLLEDRSIVLSGKRIERVEPSASSSVPAGARIVDGSGAYVIPGLWDMHVHLGTLEEVTLGVLVANGITGCATWGTVRPREGAPRPHRVGRADRSADRGCGADRRGCALAPARHEAGGGAS